MTDYSPVAGNGSLPFTMTASVALTGGQLAVVTGVNTVGPAGAASTLCVGVAAHDAAIGARVTLWPLDGLIHESVTPAGVTAGQGVQTAAAGTVDTVTTSIPAGAAAATLLGIAITTATAGLKVRWIGRT